MKANFLKSITPVLAVVLGIGGAFLTTSAAGSKSLDVKAGYLRVSENNCTYQRECQTEETPDVCMFLGSRVWGKYNPTDADCIQPLYHIEEN